MTPHYDDALSDIWTGTTNWRMWTRMGWQEVKRRYRRTAIGPFWTSLSLGVFVFSLGFLWAHLWHQDAKTYLPYFASGMIIWVFISSIVTEGCTTFTANEPLIKQINISYTLLTWTAVWRNFLVFAHNLIVFAIVVVYAGVPINLNTLLVIPGMLILCLTGVWLASFLGMMCARYRDIQQLITSLLQIALFLTPIFYSPSQLQGTIVKIAELNPLYHYVEVVREPLLGRAPSGLDYAVAIGGTILGWALTFDLYSRFRRRVAYWL